MYPSIFAASNHPQLQQRLQSSTDATPSGGGSNGNNIQAENQLKTSSLSQTVQQQQQPQQRPSARESRPFFISKFRQIFHAQQRFKKWERKKNDCQRDFQAFN